MELPILGELVPGGLEYGRSYLVEFASFSDAIFEFRSREEGEGIENYVSLRMLRERACDTSWRRLKLGENGEVKLGHDRERLRELGFRG